MNGTEPSPLEAERRYLIKQPIEALPAGPDQKLDEMSRINFTQTVCVEHNVQVMDVGMVAYKSLPYLRQYFKDHCD